MIDLTKAAVWGSAALFCIAAWTLAAYTTISSWVSVIDWMFTRSNELATADVFVVIGSVFVVAFIAAWLHHEMSLRRERELAWRLTTEPSVGRTPER